MSTFSRIKNQQTISWLVHKGNHVKLFTARLVYIEPLTVSNGREHLLIGLPYSLPLATWDQEFITTIKGHNLIQSS